MDVALDFNTDNFLFKSTVTFNYSPLPILNDVKVESLHEYQTANQEIDPSQVKKSKAVDVPQRKVFVDPQLSDFAAKTKENCFTN